MKFLCVLLSIMALSALSVPAIAAPATAAHSDLITKGPWVDVRAFSNLSAAKTSPQTAGKEIWITNAQTVNNLTLPADRKITFVKGGSISVNSGKTLTVNGPFTAGDYQVFSGSGVVNFGNGIREVCPEWWYNNSGDWHNAILAAVNSTQSNANTSRVLFSAKTYTTTPLSFLGTSGVYLIGDGASTPWKAGTIIKFITGGAGVVGLQFSPTINPLGATTGTSKYPTVKNIFIDCDNKVSIGINGSYGVLFENVIVRRATQHGIQLEDFTYPCTLRNVESSYNGIHGIFIRGPMSTAYTIQDCEFSFNTGYGMYIEGGASSSINDTKVQSNVRGGVKIYKADYSTINGDHVAISADSFLGPITFNTLYAEANGTIGAGGAYEGDYALVIDSYDQTVSSILAPSVIIFNGGSINKSTSGKYANINRVYQFEFNNTLMSGTIGVDILLGTYAVAGTYWGGSFPLTGDTAGANNNLLSIYHTISKAGNAGYAPKGMLVKGLWMPERGRVQQHQFVLDTTGLAAGTYLMHTPMSLALGATSITKGVVMPFTGSVLSLDLHKSGGVYGFGGGSGVITAIPKFTFGPTISGIIGQPGVAWAGLPVTSLNTGSMYTSHTALNLGQYEFQTNYAVGIEITIPAGYVAGTYPLIVGTLVTEY